MPGESSSIVFVSNYTQTHDYSGASAFGPIRPITAGAHPIFRTDKLVEEIASAIVHSRADDYLLISGSSVIAGLCLAQWFMMHGKCNLLLFEKRDKPRYVLRTLVKDEIRLVMERAFDKATELRP